MVSELFLARNGHELAAEDSACAVAFLRLAAGDRQQIELEAWIREHTRAGPGAAALASGAARRPVQQPAL